MSSSSRSHNFPSMETEEIDGEIKIECKCGLKCKTWTSWTEKNPCRRFMGCPSFNGSKRHCNYFSWVDPELTHYWYKTNMYQLHFDLEKQKRDKRLEFELKESNESKRVLDFELKEANESKRVLELELKEAKKKSFLYYSLMVVLLILNFALVFNLV